MIRRRLSSYADVFGLARELPPAGEPVAPGDVVRTGPNRHPLYRVIAVYEDRAWIRGVAKGRDHIVPLRRLRKAAVGEAERGASARPGGGGPPAGGEPGAGTRTPPD